MNSETRIKTLNEQITDENVQNIVIINTLRETINLLQTQLLEKDAKILKLKKKLNDALIKIEDISRMNAVLVDVEKLKIKV